MELSGVRPIVRLTVYAVLLGVGLGACGAAPAAPHPCAIQHPQPLLQAEAQEQLEAYLEATGLTAQVQIREEGTFMLGAYPRSKVLWSIGITEPALTTDDVRLQDIALAAYCLRPGWVWLTIRTPQATHEMITYSDDDLDQLTTR